MSFVRMLEVLGVAVLTAACSSEAPDSEPASDGVEDTETSEEPTIDTTTSCGTTPDCTGDTDTDEEDVPDPCTSGETARIGLSRYYDLQQALDGATDGEVVTLCPGVHEGPLFISDVAITVTGFTKDPADVVLEGLGTTRIMDLIDADVTFQYLTFQNGVSTYYDGGGDPGRPDDASGDQ